MKFSNIYLIIGLMTLLVSCKHFEPTPECSWHDLDHEYQFQPFDLAYSWDFSDNFILGSGGDLSLQTNHLYSFYPLTQKGDANNNQNTAAIFFHQVPDPDECILSDTNHPTNSFQVQLGDTDFHPYGKVGFQSFFASLCDNAFAGENSVSIRTDVFVNYKTAVQNYYYLKWATTQLTDVDNGITLSSAMPLNEMASIQYLTANTPNARLIADAKNGYVYVHGNRNGL